MADGLANHRIGDSRSRSSVRLCHSQSPYQSDVNLRTPAALSRFFASRSALSRLRSFLSQPFASTSVLLLKLHWFLRDSARSRLLISLSSLPVVALPATSLATSQGTCARRPTAS